MYCACSCARGRLSRLSALRQACRNVSVTLYRHVSHQQTLQNFLSSCQVCSSTYHVHVACEMQVNASRNLTPPCLSAHCIRHNISMIQAFYQALHISASNVTLIQTVYPALLTSAVSGIGHRIHTPKKKVILENVYLRSHLTMEQASQKPGKCCMHGDVDACGHSSDTYRPRDPYNA